MSLTFPLHSWFLAFSLLLVAYVIRRHGSDASLRRIGLGVFALSILTGLGTALTPRNSVIADAPVQALPKLPPPSTEAGLADEKIPPQVAELLALLEKIKASQPVTPSRIRAVEPAKRLPGTRAGNVVTLSR
jgi:hypothetical protein